MISIYLLTARAVAPPSTPPSSTTRRPIRPARPVIIGLKAKRPVRPIRPGSRGPLVHWPITVQPLTSAAKLRDHTALFFFASATDSNSTWTYISASSAIPIVILPYSQQPPSTAAFLVHRYLGTKQTLIYACGGFRQVTRQQPARAGSGNGGLFFLYSRLAFGVERKSAPNHYMPCFAAVLPRIRASQQNSLSLVLLATLCLL
ncbi:hypothetical protein F4803DRAFT_499106 [Xylaria telfairii]|nr:hypothetical protein F4803DRAFT_499106 [Xylaria telfairii]